jgi:hypothetical protein
MTTDEELRSAVDALGESMLVTGSGATGRRVATRLAEYDVSATNALDSPDAVVVAVDATDRSDGELPAIPSLPDALVRIAVVSVPDSPAENERQVLETLADRVGTTLLVSGTGVETLTEAVETLVSIVHDSGVVNIDLADAQTVFESGELAALCIGESADGEPATAVENAFGALPAGIKSDSAYGVLVDVVGPPTMSVGAVSDAVSTVRNYVGPDAHVIWGGTVDPELGSGLRIRLVLAGVKNARVVPGDPCPRCGSSLSTYTLGDRTSTACDTCGFAGVSVRLRD